MPRSAPSRNTWISLWPRRHAQQHPALRNRAQSALRHVPRPENSAGLSKLPEQAAEGGRMTSTMRAALLRAPGRNLDITRMDVPKPGPGELLVRIEACGICHTDLHV